MMPIKGCRIKCDECINFDMCYNCYKDDKIYSIHKHEKIHSTLLFLMPKLLVFDVE